MTDITINYLAAIRAYQKFPALWDPKHEQYGDKERRQRYWSSFKLEYEKIAGVDAPRNLVVATRKLTTKYTNEEERKQKHACQNTNEPYEYLMELEHFEALNFLKGIKKRVRKI